MTIRILLSDDHEIVREGFRALIERQDDMEIIAETADGREAVAQAVRQKPDVVVLDIGLPGLNGIDAARQILDQCPHIKIIALSVHQETRYVTEMLKAGASGYLVKTCAFGELIQAIHAVVANETYLSSKVAATVVDQALNPGADSDQQAPTSALSSREREVLQLLVEGKSSKEIANCLDVTTRTVDLHRQNVMKKLELYSVAELTKYAIRTGMTSLD
ncbi:MAG: response regulator [Phycisphaerae bacterium]